MTTNVQDQQDTTVDEAAPAVELKVIADSTTGYAAIQNNIPVVRSLVVKNTSAEALKSLDVQVSCTPAFAQGARFQFEYLAPGEF